MDTVRYNAKSTKTVAHRGLSGIEKENTNASFTAAGNRSYWGIETDVRRTGDGQFVILHDADTVRVSGIVCNVEQTSFDVLRHIRLPDRDGSRDRVDLRLPSLGEYITICKKYGKHAVLELKSIFTGEEIGKMVGIIRDLGWLDHVTFIAFDFDNLVRVREILPEQPVQFLTQTVTDEIVGRLREHKMDIDADRRCMTAEWVEKLHASGIRINVWTVNDPEEGDRLAGWGVDYITTNILECP